MRIKGRPACVLSDLMRMPPPLAAFFPSRRSTTSFPHTCTYSVHYILHPSLSSSSCCLASPRPAAQQPNLSRQTAASESLPRRPSLAGTALQHWAGPHHQNSWCFQSQSRITYYCCAIHTISHLSFLTCFFYHSFSYPTLHIFLFSRSIVSHAVTTPPSGLSHPPTPDLLQLQVHSVNVSQG